MLGNTASLIRDNLRLVHQRITAACVRSSRSASEVRLLLATKTVPAERIRLALEAGENLIGENKVQELKKKDQVLAGQTVERHFIGHLQSNKIAEVLKYATCIQSVDRLSVAEALQHRMARDGRSLDIMVQVNTSFEDSKFGRHPSDAVAFVEALRQYPLLRIRGLMTIGLFDADPEKVRPSFRLLRQLREQIIEKSLLSPVEFSELSMGMSGDLETAIEEGATIVRVGTAVFGRRQYPDSYYWNEQTPGT